MVEKEDLNNKIKHLHFDTTAIKKNIETCEKKQNLYERSQQQST